MRAWKKQVDATKRIFLYFRAHPFKFFTSEHVAAQTKITKKATRQIIAELENIGKLEGVDTVSSKWWGKPRRMWRSVRGGSDSLHQLEVFNDRQAVKQPVEEVPPEQITL